MLEDCSTCDHVKYCIRHGETCYERYCGKYSWYNSRNECKKLAEKLSTNITLILEVAKKYWLKEEPCNEYWLGVHKEDWHIQSNGKGVCNKTFQSRKRHAVVLTQAIIIIDRRCLSKK